MSGDEGNGKGSGKAAGNRWTTRNLVPNSGVVRRQPFGMNRSGPLDSEPPQPGTARRSMGLLEVMVDQLPMLTEKGLRQWLLRSHLGETSGKA